jgi:hypothetical protein
VHRKNIWENGATVDSVGLQTVVLGFRGFRRFLCKITLILKRNSCSKSPKSSSCFF